MIETQIKWRGKLHWFVHKDDYDEQEKEIVDLKEQLDDLIQGVERMQDELVSNSKIMANQSRKNKELKSILNDIITSEVVIYLSENMRNRIKEIL